MGDSLEYLADRLFWLFLPILIGLVWKHLSPKNRCILLGTLISTLAYMVVFSPSIVLIMTGFDLIGLILMFPTALLFLPVLWNILLKSYKMVYGKEF